VLDSEVFASAGEGFGEVAATIVSHDAFDGSRVYSTWWNSTDDWAWWFRIDHAFTNSAPVTVKLRLEAIVVLGEDREFDPHTAVKVSREA